MTIADLPSPTQNNVEKKNEEKSDRISLLKIALSTPFTIALLGLSVMSFVKQNELVTFLGLLGKFVEVFHEATYGITKLFILFLEKVIPWAKIHIQQAASDYLWASFIFWLPIIRLFFIEKLYVSALYISYTVFISNVYLLSARKPIEDQSTIFVIIASALVCYFTVIISLFSQCEYLHAKCLAILRNHLGAALIILSLYFAGFIELVA